MTRVAIQHQPEASARKGVAAAFFLAGASGWYVVFWELPHGKPGPGQVAGRGLASSIRRRYHDGFVPSKAIPHPTLERRDDEEAVFSVPGLGPTFGPRNAVLGM